MPLDSIHSSREVLFVGPLNPHQNHTTDNTKIIERVQSYNYSVVPSINSVLGIEQKNNTYYTNPQLSLEISYLATNGFNERNFGLYTNGLDSVSGFFIKLEESAPNIFVAQSINKHEGLRDTSLNKKIIGFGNCSLLSYTFNAAIGSLATCSASFNPLNVATFGSGSGMWLPSVKTAQNNGQRDTEYSFITPTGNAYSLGALDFDSNDSNTVDFIAPQDIVLSFPSGASLFSNQSDIYGLNVQSFSLSCETVRDDVFSVGKYFPVERRLNFPISVNLNMEILASEIEINDVYNIRCGNNERDISIYLKKNCTDSIAMEFHLKGAKLAEYSETINVNGRKQASIRYEALINDPFDTGVNLFVKAYQGTAILTPTSTQYVSGFDAFGFPYVETITTYSKTILENS